MSTDLTHVRSARRMLACLLLAGSTLVAGPPLASGQDSGPEPDVRIRAARFWRPEGRTLIEGLVGMPVRGASVPVEVGLVVRDAGGKVLHQESWVDSTAVRLASLGQVTTGAETASPITVAVAEGRYTITTTVRQGSWSDSAVVQVDGFAEQPLISDVLLSSRIRPLTDTEAPTAAETRKGRYAIERAVLPKILPTDPHIAYYLELYPVKGVTSQEVEFAVVRAAGGEPLVRVPRTVTMGERGGFEAARLPIQGLPPGDYRLVVTARAGERLERREAAFVMGDLTDLPAAIAAPVATGTESAVYEKYFAPTALSDSMVTAVVEAMTMATPGPVVTRNNRELPADAKRRFLARYWSRLPDPAPATQEHELLEEYIQRVQFVAREYFERDIGRQGSRTDRGRIYLKFGPPDAKQLLPMEGRKAAEVWKYTRQRNLKYAFLDETGFQNFSLVFTTDPNELSLSDWEDRIQNAEAVRLIKSF